MIDSLESKVLLSAPVTSRNGKSMTEIRAHQVFLNSLPSSWIPREKVNNPHVDYIIELSGPDLPTTFFSVVLKGISNFKCDDTHILHSFEAEVLNFYNDNNNDPVFLVVADTKKEVAYWLFLQEYINNVLEISQPNWRNNKSVTLRIPIANQLQLTQEFLKTTVIQGLELLYLNKFHFPFRDVQRRVSDFFRSTESIERALLIASTRPYGLHLSQSKQSCSSDSCSSCSDKSEETFDGPADYSVQLSINEAQSLKLLDPRENRKAYYCIYNALEQAGDSVSAGMRYTAMGEMVFYDYLLHFIRSFESAGTGVIYHTSRVEEYMRYFIAINQLVQYIIGALDECELIPTSLLTIRLADTYLFATPYISRNFGQDKAAPLMDFAQSLLILAHEMASLIESPNSVLQ